MTLGQYIAKCRKDKNLTQEALATKIGTNQATVANWEMDRRIPSTAMVEYIHQALALSTIYRLSFYYGQAYSFRVIERLRRAS
ncbi:MAG: helix-turn-helix transcriptional regulator [candidate division Zixibacteria bacterium]|nr:helix-turn-helix transcriptional regulator [candidate division Zixibacteria bacterium]